MSIITETITGIYYGLDEARLLGMRDDVLAQIALARAGKRFASVGGGGKSFTKDNMSLPELRQDIAEITAALRRANPAVYGKRVRRMHADFSNLTP